MGLHDVPMHPHFLNYENIQIKIYDDRLTPDIIEPISTIPANQLHAWDFCSIDSIIDTSNRFWSYAITLAIDPQYPFPMLTFLTGSDPGREPPRLDCIFLLADPVYLALTHKGKRSRQLMEVRNLYLDTKNMLVRRMPGAR